MILPRIVLIILVTLLAVPVLVAEDGRITLKKGDRIVFLGDSITQAGVGPKGYITLIKNALLEQHKGLEIDVIGAGISGNKVPDLQRRVDKDVIVRKPTIVFIYIGINDVWHGEVDPARGTPKDKFEAGLKEVIGKITDAGARVVLCTPSVIGEKADGSNKLDTKLDEYADVSRKVAQELKLPLCDLRKEFIAHLKEKNQANKESGLLTSDRVHLNEAGNRFVAMVMLKTLGVALAADEPMPATVADNAKLVTVYSEAFFFEGPTWDPKGNKLYFTAFGPKNTQILRLDGPNKAAVWLDKSEGVNGTYLSKDGRLLGAQVYSHKVVSYGFGADGPADPKALFHDAKLNQPNDICQAPNGNIYFTDPDFNKHQSAVYLLTPDGKASKVVTDMPVPNGIKTSLDGKTLYISDSHLKLWRSYPIKDDGSVGEGKVFFNPDVPEKQEPDGLCLDEQGNLYLTGRGGMWVVTPEGKSLGRIRIPEFCSNVTFGGDDGKTLYMTCDKKVYSLAMKVRGGLFKK